MSNSNVLNSSAINFQCSTLETNTQFTEYLFTAYILTSILNGISSITAITGNAVVILVVWKTRELLSCLALSDLTVGLIAQPSFVIHKIGELNNCLSMYCTTRILTESLGCITAGTSVLTMTGISIEEGGKGFMQRYLALSLHLRYRAIVTTKRILIAASCVWIFFILISASRFWIANDVIFNMISLPVIFSSLVFTLLAYVRILKCVRRHERQISDQNNLPESSRSVNCQVLKINCYKKSTLTMVYIVGIFVFCYIPFLINNDLDRHILAKTSDKSVRRFGDILAPLSRETKLNMLN
ncbi:adrenocorticotropic hormone receptor-like [Montipora foliosa]|uniref:adrenocorticotropic hormone receptor-like n=1 Tax=Montipora foliosa TaxID=591990 RepID=UPI0035F20DE4